MMLGVGDMPPRFYRRRRWRRRLYRRHNSGIATREVRSKTAASGRR